MKDNKNIISYYYYYIPLLSEFGGKSFVMRLQLNHLLSDYQINYFLKPIKRSLKQYLKRIAVSFKEGYNKLLLFVF